MLARSFALLNEVSQCENILSGSGTWGKRMLFWKAWNAFVATRMDTLCALRMFRVTQSCLVTCTFFIARIIDKFFQTSTKLDNVPGCESILGQLARVHNLCEHIKYANVCVELSLLEADETLMFCDMGVLLGLERDANIIWFAITTLIFFIGLIRRGVRLGWIEYSKAGI